MTRARLYTWPVIALIATGAVPVSAGQAAFEGVYIASGVDAEGNQYRRAVDIERHGDRFTVTWVEADMVGQAVILEPTWVGVGIVNGDTLSVSFVAEDTLGIMVYTFGGDGQVSGNWTLAGDDERVYSETLTKLPDTLPEPAAADPSEDHPRPSSPSSAGTVSL
jgi:hypothetical protein